jgi:hypothetical protein
MRLTSSDGRRIENTFQMRQSFANNIREFTISKIEVTRFGVTVRASVLRLSSKRFTSATLTLRFLLNPMAEQLLINR